MVQIFGRENVQSVRVEEHNIEGDVKMQEYKKVNQFDPKGKHFLFNFTENECGKVATGICDLDCDNKDARCNTIINMFKEYPSILNWCPITIVKYKCGHYENSDGRHRTCAAMKLGTKIDIELYEDDELCQECQSSDPDNYDLEFIEITK